MWTALGFERVPCTWLEFFCGQSEMTFRQLPNDRFSPNLATIRESVRVRSRAVARIFKNFPFYGHLPSKASKLKGSNRHLTLTSLQPRGRTAERHRSLHVAMQSKGHAGSLRGIGPIFIRRTFSDGATGRQTSPLFEFLLIFRYKTPKSTFCTRPIYSPGVTLQNASGKPVRPITCS